MKMIMIVAIWVRYVDACTQTRMLIFDATSAYRLCELMQTYTKLLLFSDPKNCFPES